MSLNKVNLVGVELLIDVLFVLRTYDRVLLLIILTSYCWHLNLLSTLYLVNLGKGYNYWLWTIFSVRFLRDINFLLYIVNIHDVDLMCNISKIIRFGKKSVLLT